MKENRCSNCEFSEKCKYAYNYDFCEDCKYYGECGLTGAFSECKKGYEIECNNGFEEKAFEEEI